MTQECHIQQGLCLHTKVRYGVVETTFGAGHNAPKVRYDRVGQFVPFRSELLADE